MGEPVKAEIILYQNEGANVPVSHRQRDEHRNRNGKCHRQDGRESRARVSAFPGRQRRA